MPELEEVLVSVVSTLLDGSKSVEIDGNRRQEVSRQVVREVWIETGRFSV